MAKLRLILGDQLNEQHSWYTTPESDCIYLMAEMLQETDCRDVPQRSGFERADGAGLIGHLIRRMQADLPKLDVVKKDGVLEIFEIFLVASPVDAEVPPLQNGDHCLVLGRPPLLSVNFVGHLPPPLQVSDSFAHKVQREHLECQVFFCMLG